MHRRGMEATKQWAASGNHSKTKADPARQTALITWLGPEPRTCSMTVSKPACSSCFGLKRLRSSTMYWLLYVPAAQV